MKKRRENRKSFDLFRIKKKKGGFSVSLYYNTHLIMV